MIRVCCLCERWESGGIESFLCSALKHIDPSDVKVDIVAASLGESVFTAPLEKLGIEFFELSGSQRRISENHRIFRDIVKNRKYDVLHLNAFHSLSLAYLKIAKEENIPARIAHSHNTALRKSCTYHIKMLINAWARNKYTKYATKLWACSGNAAKFLFSKNILEQRGSTFIPNGIETERFRFNPELRQKLRRELNIEENFVIGSIGRLCFQKNQSFLLDVLYEALKQDPKARLLLVGNGKDKTLLIKKAEKLKISDKVIFYGNTNRPEQLLWAMDAFAFPSLFEGFGIAAVEALAAGLPAVCSENVPEEVHISSHIRILSLKTGPSAWADALLNSKRFAGGEIEAAEAGFDIETVSKEIVSRFKDVSE